MSVPELPASALASLVLSQSAPTSAYALTAGRVWSVVAVLFGLAGIVIGALALARAAGRIGHGTGRAGAILAVLAGLIGAAIGGMVVASAEGGPGTGYGIVGGYAAIVVGLIATILGGLAAARSRRVDSPVDSPTRSRSVR